RLEVHPLLPPDVIVQQPPDPPHEFRIGRDRLRLALAPPRQFAQHAVLAHQPLAHLRAAGQRQQQPLLIIKVPANLPPPRRRKPPNRRHRPLPPSRRLHPRRGLLQVPRL